MCGEWEFGGLPAWLFENGSIPIRTMAHPYVDFATRYWSKGLFPQVKPMLYANGGPVVMVQVRWMRHCDTSRSMRGHKPSCGHAQRGRCV